MAWRNVIVGMPLGWQGTILDFSFLDRLSSDVEAPDGTNYTFEDILANQFTESYLFGDSNCGINVTSASTGWRCHKMLNGSDMGGGTSVVCYNYQEPDQPNRWYRNFRYSFTFYACVNDDTQKGYFFAIYRSMREYNYSDTYHCGMNNTAWANQEDVYQILTGNQQSLYTSNGGGATHIAKVTGQLKDLSSNLSDILLISGGGGGGLLVGETDYSGKEAGGISGSGDNSADQSTGNAFGQGESGTDVSGGGSGLYGGYKGTSSKSGGAGSGYIGNSLVSNKKMVGFNVPTSSAESTKTESVSQASATPTPNVPKIGNGFARIKLLSEQQTKSFFNVVSSYDLTNVGGGITADSIDYSNYLGRIVFYGQSNRKLLSINDGVFNYTSALSYTQSNLAFPLKDYPIRITKVTCKVTLKELRGDNRWVDLKIICNSGLIGRAKYAFTDPDPVNINLNEETSFTFDVSSSNMQATHIDFQFSYGIWEVKEIMVSYV